MHSRIIPVAEKRIVCFQSKTVIICRFVFTFNNYYIYLKRYFEKFLTKVFTIFWRNAALSLILVWLIQKVRFNFFFQRRTQKHRYNCKDNNVQIVLMLIQLTLSAHEQYYWIVLKHKVYCILSLSVSNWDIITSFNSGLIANCRKQLRANAQKEVWSFREERYSFFRSLRA